MAELAWPADLGHGTFVGRFGFMDADTHDPGREPDITSATGGTVTITPSIKSVRYTGVSGPMILAARPARGVIDAEGYLCTMNAEGATGDRGMVFPATDDTDLSPTDWTYSVSITLDGSVRLPSFDVKLPEGSTVDLSVAVPVPPSGGTAIVVDPTTATRAEAAADRAETAADEAEDWAPSFVWDGTSLVIDGGEPVDLKGEQGPEGQGGAEGPYGGTAVTDPQVASYILAGNETATSLAVAEFTAPQADYVALLSGLASYDRMTVTKADQWGSLAVRCSSPAGGNVTYTITNNLNYQYVAEVATLDPASAGPGEGDVVTSSFRSIDLTLTNFTWKAVTTTPYVEQVGAVWTCSVTTTTSNARVVFQSQADNRGGLWRLSVDGTALQADVSTWAADFVAISVEALTIPSPGTYTIRGEFIGDDPVNAPSAGVSRGWTKGINATDGNQTVKLVENGSAVPVEQQLSPRSNKDFALRLKPFDAAASEFVPRHGTASEAFASPTRYLNAGAPLDVASMAVGQAVEVDSFEWVQHIWGRNSNTGTRNIAEVWTTQRITPDGVFHVAGRWKPLEDLEAGGRVYHLMMMGSTPLFDEAVSSLSGGYPLTGPVGNIFTTEGNLADSWALLSSTSSAVASVRYNNRRESLRTGQVDAPERGNQAFIELRADGTQAKVYPATYAVGAVIPQGRMHRFSGTYFYGSVPGAHDSLSLQ